MDHKEKNLSEYIDRLNAEQKPEEHEKRAGSPEMEKLFDTVRRVHSLKEPAMPKGDYPEKLVRIVEGLSQKAPAQNRKRIWRIGMASVAAVLVAVVMLAFLLPIGRTDMVYAMEEAFKKVEAYHGFLEFVETNQAGETSTQAKLEVWADKEGHYYLKGLEGAQAGLTTVNNGQKKWQIRPDQQQVYVFPAFPDAYRFTFELGKEVQEIKNAVTTKVVGEETVAGRQASILEVSPQGGVPYRIWIDKETELPLQKESGMQNALQYRVTYTKLEYSNVIPAELKTFRVPDGFKEIDTNPEQLVNSMEEAREAVGFAPVAPENVPAGYAREYVAIAPEAKLVKLYYASPDKEKRVVVLQGKAAGELKPASTAVQGKVNDRTAEIQSPVQGDLGIPGGGGLYAGMTNINSIRWQQDGFEYAVVGNVSLEGLIPFVKGVAKGTVEIPSPDAQASTKPQVEVPVDLQVEENGQKSADSGHSPWKLDPAFVAQVFVSLKISPEGITGDYPIQLDELNVIQNSGKDAVVEVSGDKTPIRKVYLKRLIRQDSTGIWTVVGYDPVGKQ